MAKYAGKADLKVKNVQLKYLFSITLHRVELHVPREFTVSIVFRTGNKGLKRLESKQIPAVSA